MCKRCSDRFSRKDIDKLTEYVKKYKAKGLAWVKVIEEGFNGPIAKFFNEEEVAQLKLHQMLKLVTYYYLLLIKNQLLPIV